MTAGKKAAWQTGHAAFWLKENSQPNWKFSFNQSDCPLKERRQIINGYGEAAEAVDGVLYNTLCLA